MWGEPEVGTSYLKPREEDAWTSDKAIVSRCLSRQSLLPFLSCHLSHRPIQIFVFSASLAFRIIGCLGSGTLSNHGTGTCTLGRSPLARIVAWLCCLGPRRIVRRSGPASSSQSSTCGHSLLLSILSATSLSIHGTACTTVQ